MKTSLNRLQLLAKLLVMVAVITTLAQCGKTTSGPASGTFGSVYASINSSNCTTCHRPSGSAQTDASVTVDFTAASASVYTQLTTGRSLTTKTPACKTAKFVVAGDDTKSYFLGLLISSYSVNNFGGLTGCLPNYNDHHTNANLSADEQASFIAWVKNGAKND